jgi:Arc/MetJ-type ribon-helix-helix transcriptional regulator
MVRRGPSTCLLARRGEAVRAALRALQLARHDIGADHEHERAELARDAQAASV